MATALLHQQSRMAVEAARPPVAADHQELTLPLVVVDDQGVRVAVVEGGVRPHRLVVVDHTPDEVGAEVHGVSVEPRQGGVWRGKSPEPGHRRTHVCMVTHKRKHIDRRTQIQTQTHTHTHTHTHTITHTHTDAYELAMQS